MMTRRHGSHAGWMGKGARNRQARKHADQARIGVSAAAVTRVQRNIEDGRELIGGLDASDLPGEISRRLVRFDEIARPHHAVTLLAHILRSNLPAPPDTYVESEDEGSWPVIELALARLVRRTDPAGAAEPPPAIDGNVLGDIRTVLQEALVIEAVRSAQNLEGDDPRELAVRHRSVIQRLFLRAPGYHWQEQALVRELFGATNLQARLRESLGFTADDAVTLHTVATDLLQHGFQDHLQQLFDVVRELRAGGREDIAAAVDPMLDLSANTIAADHVNALRAVLWGMRTLGDAIVSTVDGLAKGAGLDHDTAAAFVEAVSLPFGAEVPENPVTAMDQVRARPLIRDGDRVVLAGAPELIWAIRPALETGFAGRSWETYQRHRGRWVETRAAQLLTSALAPDEVHTGLDYTYVAADGTCRAGELDVLLRVDDVLLIVEAKAATVGGRAGGQKLIDHLSKVFTKAATQASDARAAFHGSGVLELRSGRDRVRLTTDHIREIHPIIVSLDDLSVIAPNASHLIGSRLLPDGVTVPWIVTVHELQIVCELVDNPAQLVHFLRRRSQLNLIGQHEAADELDWWMSYLDTNLYLAAVPEIPTRLMSQTDALDAYMFYSHGHRTAPAPRPQHALDRATVAVLSQLAEDRPPGWIAASCALLDPEGAARAAFLATCKQLRGRARRCGRAQRCAQHYSADATAASLLLCAVVVPDAGKGHLTALLHEYIAERLEAEPAERVVAFGITVASRKAFDALVVLEPSLWTTHAPTRDD